MTHAAKDLIMVLLENSGLFLARLELVHLSVAQVPGADEC